MRHVIGILSSLTSIFQQEYAISLLATFWPARLAVFQHFTAPRRNGAYNFDTGLRKLRQSILQLLPLPGFLSFEISHSA